MLKKDKFFCCVRINPKIIVDVFFQMTRNDFFSFTQTLFIFTTAEFYKFEAFLFETVPVWGSFVEYEIASLFQGGSASYNDKNAQRCHRL